MLYVSILILADCVSGAPAMLEIVWDKENLRVRSPHEANTI